MEILENKSIIRLKNRLRFLSRQQKLVVLYKCIKIKSFKIKCVQHSVDVNGSSFDFKTLYSKFIRHPFSFHAFTPDRAFHLL